ncbi:MAG TPA: ASCH domain-containing protein [Candidatus Paceibacterota bacterium]|nr:ASCH domain-containing protein [Candidatus Paceibacterota bacterium]
MKLNKDAFELVKNGGKCIEVRLYDEKRRQLKLGEKIIFSKAGGPEEKIQAKVSALLLYPDFRSLYSDFDPKDFGGEGWTIDQLVENIHGYYSEEDEEKYGVMGIKLEVLSR